MPGGKGLRSNLLSSSRCSPYRSHKSFAGVASMESPMQCLVRNPSQFCNFRKRTQFPIKHSPWCDFPVSGLEPSINPSAIFRAIVSIIINALNGVFFAWRNTHISQEILKRLVPAVTYFYSATAVSVENIGVWIVAPLPYRGPCRINFCPSKTMIKPRRMIRLVAAARLLLAVKHVIAKSLNRFSAIAAKQPPSLTVSRLVLDSFNGCQAVELAPS